MTDIDFGKEKLPTVIQNPFGKTKIRRVCVFFYPFGTMGDSCAKASGSIEFYNGETKGEQSFMGDTFDEVVLKMKAMLENMES